MQKGIILLILASLLFTFCNKPKYEVALRNDTYYANARITIAGKADIVYPQSSETIAELTKGNYNWDLLLTYTESGETVGTASGSVYVDKNKTLVVDFDTDINDYAYYWE